MNQSSLVAVRSDGSGARSMGKIPSAMAYGHAIEIAGKVMLVLAVPNDRSDIWVIDKFDGGRR